MPVLAKAAEWHWMFGAVVYQQKSPYWDTPWCGWLCGRGRPWWSPGSWSSPCWERWPPSSAGRTPQAARRWWPPASDRLGPRQDCLCTGTGAPPETRPDWRRFIIPVNAALIDCNTKRAFVNLYHFKKVSSQPLSLISNMTHDQDQHSCMKLTALNVREKYDCSIN